MSYKFKSLHDFAEGGEIATLESGHFQCDCCDRDISHKEPALYFEGWEDNPWVCQECIHRVSKFFDRRETILRTLFPPGGGVDLSEIKKVIAGEYLSGRMVEVEIRLVPHGKTVQKNLTVKEIP